MAKVGVQKKILLPEGSYQILEILNEDIEAGFYGPQWSLEFRVVSGQFAGHVFKDWPSMGGEVLADADGNPVDVEAPFYKEDSKAWTIYTAAVGKEPGPGADTSEVVGGRIMARIELAGQQQNRNRIAHGSVGAPPADTNGNVSGAPDNGGSGLWDAQQRASDAADPRGDI